MDDLADAYVFLMERYDYRDIGLFVNIGTGKDISIRELDELIKDVVRYEGELTFNTDKLDGTPRKLLDVRRMKQLGWKVKTDLEDGVKMTYEWFKVNTR
ncbi:GDP-L-fucose synthase [subsurface metagenome]